jgi:hypothetical protein
MSQLAHQNKGEIYDYFASKGLVSKDELKSVKSIKADFVTLGTPVRYKWAPGNYKLLHIVNHRGPKLEGIGLRGFQTSKYGDYIQIWGCYGSDFIANSKSDREFNKELNELLEGNREDNVPIRPQSPGGWFKNIETKSKINHQGHTLLVNFEPKLTIKNNFLTTFFGHGVYMKHNNIAQLFKIISTHLDKFKNMNK